MAIEISLSGGICSDKHSSERIYFWAVSPTDIESPLYKSQALGIKQVYSQKRNVPASGSTRQGEYFSAAYSLEYASRIMIVFMQTSFGDPQKRYQIFIDVGESKEGISIKMGHENFGTFQGRGHIDMEKSTVILGAGRARVIHPIKKAELLSVFNYELVSLPSNTERNPNTRKVIW